MFYFPFISTNNGIKMDDRQYPWKPRIYPGALPSCLQHDILYIVSLPEQRRDFVVCEAGDAKAM